MKNLLYIPACCLMLLLTLFTSCEKDELIDSQQLVPQENLSDQLLRRNCGMAELHQSRMQDPGYQQKHEERLEKMINTPALKADCSTPTILPLAFHFQGTRNADISCLRQMAQEQVDILNADFAGTNSDISRWRNEAAASFPGVSNGEACFRFCLADKNHPSGFGLSDGDPAITVNATNGENDSRWSGYINIFIQPNTGLLGSAPFGGSGNGDGISIDAAAFGTGTACGNVQAEEPFTLGRTLTHEMGHYLFLDHIWGEQESCNSDDLVADTPTSAGPYEGCPTIGASTCNSVDIHMNYMDYTNDACMYMFTSGQVSRATNYLNASLQALASNASQVCGNMDGGGDTGGGDTGGGDTSTCDDGVQNGSETGVDCGGTDCTPCQVSEEECTRPDKLIASDLTDTSVNLRWEGNSDRNLFKLSYRVKAPGPWTGRGITGNQKELTGLVASTTYQWRVLSICEDGRTPFSTISEFTTSDDGGMDNDGDCTDIRLDIRLDNYGSETTWELLDESGFVVKEGGPYPDRQDGKIVGDDFCLTDGCYSLVVYDDAGDGLCCDYGRGKLWLRDADGDAIYVSNGRFGDNVIVDFCVSEDYVGNKRIDNLLAKPQDIDPAKVEQARSRKQI